METINPAFILFFRTALSIIHSKNANETTKRRGKMKLWNGRGEMLIEYKKRTGKIANNIE